MGVSPRQKKSGRINEEVVRRGSTVYTTRVNNTFQTFLIIHYTKNPVGLKLFVPFRNHVQ